MKYIFLIISFILEGFISNYISMNTLLFNNCFTLISLLIIYPYFKNYRNYYFVSFITGLIYDITYTDKILINAYFFLIISYVIVKINKRFKEDIFSYALKILVIVTIYRILEYSILVVIDGLYFNAFKLIKSIFSSILLNVLYYIFILLFKNKTNIKFINSKQSNYV